MGSAPHWLDFLHRGGRVNDLDKCLGSWAFLVACLTNATLALGTVKFWIADLLRNNTRIVSLPIENL